MQIQYKGYTLITSNADRIVSIRRADGWVIGTALGFLEAKRDVDWILNPDRQARPPWHDADWDWLDKKLSEDDGRQFAVLIP